MAAGANQWVPMTNTRALSALKKKRMATPMNSLTKMSDQMSTQPGTGLSSTDGSMSSRGRSVSRRQMYLSSRSCLAACLLMAIDYTPSCRKPAPMLGLPPTLRYQFQNAAPDRRDQAIWIAPVSRAHTSARPGMGYNEGCAFAQLPCSHVHGAQHEKRARE